MIGAIIGDIAGSRFEWNSTKSKEFELLSHPKGCRPTDDTVMTLAVANAILRCGGDKMKLGKESVIQMQTLGRRYPRGLRRRFQPLACRGGSAAV